MLFAIITLLTALALAGTAAAFAIFGIMALFGGLPVHAMIMGIVIELGKIVGVSWVYRNWHEKTTLKYIMIPFIFVAMLLTSMGIFGLLSQAHLEQTSGVANNDIIIERLDQQINRAQLDIERAETALGQLDAAIDEFIVRGFVTRGLEAREAQQAERDQLAQIISNSQARINEWQDEQLVLNQELQKIELEVGPIKYLAALVYGEDNTNLEEAVRWAILAFIFVFDPMAIMLLMAANHTLMQRGIYLERGPPVTIEPPDGGPGGGEEPPKDEEKPKPEEEPCEADPEIGLQFELEMVEPEWDPTPEPVPDEPEESWRSIRTLADLEEEADELQQAAEELEKLAPQPVSMAQPGPLEDAQILEQVEPDDVPAPVLPERKQPEETATFVDMVPEPNETPEHFVSRLLKKHEDPGNWRLSENNDLESEQGVIARNISAEDAAQLIALASHVLEENSEEVNLGKVGNRYGIILRKLKEDK